MQSISHIRHFSLALRPRALTAAVATMVLPVLLLLLTAAAQSQTFSVIHTFTGADGSYPQAGLTMDKAGNLYGTTAAGGSSGWGTVFKLANNGSSWALTRLYSFQGGADGPIPSARVVFGPDGSLYGTTNEGGGSGCAPYSGCGTVFKLTPPAHASPNILGAWTQTVLYRFSGSDGYYPTSALTFDEAGNLYGTTLFGGLGGLGDYCGLVYKLTPSDGAWVESALHSFINHNDGCQPYSGVIFDQAGNLYGTTALSIFQLVPLGTTWKLNLLYSFGDLPYGDLIFDPFGNLYGTTAVGGSDGAGSVFMLSPSGSNWTFTVLYSFPGAPGSDGPVDRLAMDGAGNLYGTTYANGAYGYGSVFKLAPSSGGWTCNALYDFTDGTDGASALGPVLDSNGNLFGTTSSGGVGNHGVVWEITP